MQYKVVFVLLFEIIKSEKLPCHVPIYTKTPSDKLFM